jgi:electron transport complex protein RnfC
VVEGSRVIAKILRANRIIFAVSAREKDLGDNFIAQAGKWETPSIQVQVGSRYPQRNRRELELVLRNYEKAENCELGSLVILGPATLAAVYDAVKLRKPVLDRYVAVGGTAVRNPQIMKVRIGTRVGEVISQCGGFVGHPKRIATGSPLSGRAVVDLDEPILKTSYGLFAFLEGRKAGAGTGTCINCGECRSVCPCGLDPEELYKSTKINDIEQAEFFSTAATECHGCGCCDVVCPSRLPSSLSMIGSTLRGK